jgi:hypothetical protein
MIFHLFGRSVFLGVLIPLPPCFGEKRLEGVKTKDRSRQKAEKRARILLKTLRPSLQQEA